MNCDSKNSLQKNILTFLVLLVFSITIFSTKSHEAFAQQDPTTGAINVPVSEADYADLQAYVNRARKILQNTLRNSRTSGGEQLHYKLLTGVNAALEDSEQNQGLVNLKKDKLLFVAVLQGARFFDRIFNPRGNPDEVSIVSSSTVLLAAIHLALNYYNTSDRPRLHSDVLPSPDWARFAATEIPVFLRMSALAPSAHAKRKCVVALTNWVIRDLNQSTNRRKFASIIIDLAQAKSDLEAGNQSLDQVQETLANARNRILTKLGRPLQTNHASATFSTPASSYPSSIGSEEDSSQQESSNNDTSDDSHIFPLLHIRSFNNAGVHKRANLVIPEGDPLIDGVVGSFQPGIGAGVDTEGSNVSSFKAISLRASLILAATDAMPLTAYLAGRGDIGVANGKIPVYNFKVTGSADMILGLGGWIAVEADKVPQFSANNIAGGWGVTVPFVVGKKSYVLFRLGIGGYSKSGGPNDEPTNGGNVSETTQVLMHFGKFIINIEEDVDFGSTAPNGAGSTAITCTPNGGWETAYSSIQECKKHLTPLRNELATYLSIPLGIIFPNDAIRIEGNWTYYGRYAEKPPVNVFKVGGYYELRF